MIYLESEEFSTLTLSKVITNQPWKDTSSANHPVSIPIQERARLLKTAKEQEEETVTLQDNLSQARTELKAAGIRNGELKQALDEITLQLKRRVSFTPTYSSCSNTDVTGC